MVKKKDTKEIYSMSVINCQDDERIRSAMLERKILTQFRHPFIDELHYSFRSTDGKKCYLITKFLSGGELTQTLQNERKHRLPEDVIRFCAAELFLALDHLHKNNIVHNLLTPDTIFFDSDGHLYLCDFGNSKDVSRKESDMEFRIHTFDGTPEYFAPEILSSENDGKHPFASEWWTFAIILYEMIVGLPPFYSEDVQEMYYLILSSEVSFPSQSVLSISSEFKDLIRKMLNKDPKKRLGTLKSEEIKYHPFFEEIDWKMLEKKKIVPPYVPALMDEEKLDFTTVDNDFHSFQYDNSGNDNRVRDDAFRGFSFEDFSYQVLESNQQENNEGHSITDDGITNENESENGTSESRKYSNETMASQEKETYASQEKVTPKAEGKEIIKKKAEIEKVCCDEERKYHDFYYSWDEEKEMMKKREQSYVDEMERVTYLIESTVSTTSSSGRVESIGGISMFTCLLKRNDVILLVHKSLIRGN